MPGKVAHIGHNEAQEIVINFEPDQPGGWHAVFTLDEAEQFAQTVLRRVHEVRPLLEPFPLLLNAAQELAAKTWAADDRLWTTQETVEFNLRTFARVIIAGV